MIASKYVLPSLTFAAALTFIPVPSQAQETHTVTVGDNFFSPANLTIQAGDTVRWSNAAGGNPHDVTADDFSFASQTTNEFMFEMTFDDPGDVPYHCTVHGAAGGVGMSGTVTVEGGGGGGNGFQINAGLNDSWYNPATAGQGFFITVFPDISSIFLAWFTYDTERPDPAVMANLGEPGHRWLTAFGEYSGETAMLEVELTQGGVFNSGDPEPMQTADGTIVLEFAGCNDALVTYDITSAGVQGEIPIERIALDNVPGCEALAQ